MPTDLQVVAPSSSARRQFGLRGGFGMQVDETISPVVIGAEPFTAYPWRTDGLRFWFYGAPGAVAAQGNQVTVQLPQKAQVGDPDSILAVLDTIIVRNSSAAAVGNFEVGYCTGVSATTPAICLEAQSPATLQGPCPILGVAVNKAAGTMTTRLGVFTAPAPGQVVLQGLEIPLLFGAGNLDGVGVNMLSLNFGYDITLSGRFWYAR